ncbi:MAG: c-type cytochrome [Gammaproteobacteria bacterium]
MRTMKPLVFATLAVLLAAYREGSAEGVSDATPKGEEAPSTTEQNRGIDDAAMAQWKRRGEGPDWMAEELAKHKVSTPADNSGLIGKGQGATYGSITREDVNVWQQETYKSAVEGSRIFHSGDRLKSTIAVSCDMCHPDGSNTHPETYPKFQAQLGRVALLRDAINWCIENPVRGRKLAPDSAEMRALETYLYAQRKGTPLEYGKR